MRSDGATAAIVGGVVGGLSGPCADCSHCHCHSDYCQELDIFIIPRAYKRREGMQLHYLAT